MDRQFISCNDNPMIDIQQVSSINISEDLVIIFNQLDNDKLSLRWEFATNQERDNVFNQICAKYSVRFTIENPHDRFEKPLHRKY